MEYYFCINMCHRTEHWNPLYHNSGTRMTINCYGNEGIVRSLNSFNFKNPCKTFSKNIAEQKQKILPSLYTRPSSVVAAFRSLYINSRNLLKGTRKSVGLAVTESSTWKRQRTAPNENFSQISVAIVLGECANWDIVVIISGCKPVQWHSLGAHKVYQTTADRHHCRPLCSCTATTTLLIICRPPQKEWPTDFIRPLALHTSVHSSADVRSTTLI